jgi:hypothetical protein
MQLKPRLSYNTSMELIRRHQAKCEYAAASCEVTLRLPENSMQN